MNEEGYPNPLEGKFTLDRHLKGMKTMRGAVNSKEPLPVDAFRNILEQTRGAPLMVRAAALSTIHVSEFAKRDKSYTGSLILQRCDVALYAQGKLGAWNRPDVNAVELYIRGTFEVEKPTRGNRVAAEYRKPPETQLCAR